jgi:hypothetical protein
MRYWHRGIRKGISRRYAIPTLLQFHHYHSISETRQKQKAPEASDDGELQHLLKLTLRKMKQIKWEQDAKPAPPAMHFTFYTC